MGVYDFTANTIRGTQKSLSDYEGKVLLIVNTASKCGFTRQYGDLQKLYEQYKDQGLVVLGFPCNQFGAQEPGSNEEIDTFCQLNYGVTFPLFDKIDVRGPDQHPLYGYLTGQAPFEGFEDPESRLATFLQQQGLLEGDDIKWNFTKFLIDRSGNVAKRFESSVETDQMKPAIETLL